jgi:putative ABC transport system permease protein
MSLFRIAYRSILQRGVASSLTMLSMALGVALVVAVLSIHGVVSQSFRNNASLGYNMIVGAKGGREQLTLSTVYYLSSPVENIPYTYYLEFLNQEERDGHLANSFAVHSRDALRETAELASVLDNGGLGGAALHATTDRLGLTMVPDLTDKKMYAPPVELGRHGKFGRLNELAIPLCQGDYYGRFKVVGTIPALFDELVWDIENNRKFEFAQGRNFVHKSPEHGYFEAVVGATVAREMGVKLGDGINPAHGDPEGHTHARQFTVVGILAPSGTPNDRAVFVNMEGFYLMEDHAKPIEDEPTEQAGEPREMTEAEWLARLAADAQQRSAIERAVDPQPLPAEQREVTAILLKVPAMVAPGLETAINEGVHAQAVLPVAVIYGLFEFIINPIQWTLLLLTAMICVVSGISILVSIYNSMSERRGEIAVMRALGAGRGTVMTIILLEATLLALGGGVLGWVAGHAGTYAVSPWIEEKTGVQIGLLSWEPSFPVLAWLGVPISNADLITLPVESVLIPALVLLAILVGIWPAISAYRTDVAKSLGR